MQSFSDFEVIMVDDGSIDGSHKISEEFAKIDNRFVYIYKSNGGVSNARNVGIENAHGEFVLFVDSDDELYPDTLMRMCDIPADCDLFIGGYNVVDDQGNSLYSIPDRGITKLCREDGVKQMYAPSPYKYQGFIWNKLFRKSIIDSNHIRFDEDIQFNEDRLFVIRYIAAQTGAIVYDYAPVYKYFERLNGAMASVKKAFNPKFVTDFYAFIRMKDIVKKKFKSKYLNYLAQEGIFYSYSRINYMMNNSFFDKEVHKKLKWDMIQNLSFQFLVRKFLKLT